VKNIKTGQQKEGLHLQVRVFDKHTRLYGPVPHSALTTEYDEEDDERYVGGFTIGRFVGNIPHPHGLMWQWRGGEIYHGFLYGKVDSQGRFTGDNITFIYPDLETGLQGKFVNGELVEAHAVEIVAERWMNGLKELSFVEAEPIDVLWKRDVANATYIGANPMIMDPHEEKSVYKADSIGGKDDGIFARRIFQPRQLVSYFNGIKTTEAQMFHEKMTEKEELYASAYYFGLGANAPEIYNVPEDIELDIPDPYRSTDEYTATLGHKVNHKFEQTNVEFDTTDHPVYGVIVCLIATEDIDIDDELFVSYNYGLDSAPQWYRDLHDEYD
jgi:histone-lysine N-methyltransferase SETD7